MSIFSVERILYLRSCYRYSCDSSIQSKNWTTGRISVQKKKLLVLLRMVYDGGENSGLIFESLLENSKYYNT